MQLQTTEHLAEGNMQTEAKFTAPPNGYKILTIWCYSRMKTLSETDLDAAEVISARYLAPDFIEQNGR